MIKYLILFLVIIILISIIFHYELIKIPSYYIETFDSGTCFVKNQGEMNVKMKQCNIYYADEKDLCNKYPELYKLTLMQLNLLIIINTNSSTNSIQYNNKSYNKNIINRVIDDKKTKNIRSCNFTPENLYEIESIVGSTNNFTNDYKQQFGCFLPLKNTDIDKNGNINNNIISKYGNNNKACIDNNNKTPITNIVCEGTNCPVSNNFHVITNFDNVKNTYNINIPNNEIFLKIYDKTKVAFVKYDKTRNTLTNIKNLSEIINKYDNLYNILYINPTKTIKYPRYPTTAAITNYEGIKVSVYSSSGDDVYKIFDNDNNSTGWNTKVTQNIEYFSGYSGEFLKFDLGEHIVLKNFNLHPNSTNINNSPKNYRIYATNDDNYYKKLGSLINIKEDNYQRLPIRIGNTENYYYTFTSKGINNSITFLDNTICDILIVGGGAAGKIGKGGSSSGGVLYYKDIFIEKGKYKITVGVGGKNNGSSGTSSKIIGPRSNIEAIGGISSINVNGATGSGKNINNINNVKANINKVAMSGNKITDKINTSFITNRGGGGGTGTNAENLTINNGLNYKIYNISSSQPSFPGNGGKLYDSIVRKSGIVPYLNYNWGGGTILGYRHDNVMINFTGYISIPGTGVKNIIFYSRVDDGLYMKINNNVILNSWVDQGPHYYNVRSNSTQFVGGQIYPIDIWFYERGGGAVIELYWDFNGSISIIPSDVFTTSPNYGQKGGDGILNNITGTNLYYAGGGSSYNDESVASSHNSINKRGDYGYGGNSFINTFTEGGDGVVIIRFKIPKSSEGWVNIYQHSPGSIAPTSFYNAVLSNIIPYRYYAIVVKDNWADTYGCSISQLELFGYRKSPLDKRIIPPPAIYATPINNSKNVYLFIFDDDGKIKEYDTNTINNFSLKNNFKKNNNYITDKLLNTNNDNPVYGKISKIISEYINKNNNNNLILNLNDIDAYIDKYNNDTDNLGNNIDKLSKYKRAIFNDIDILDMTFERYNDYTKLYNGKFYLSNDDNIYIKL